MKVLFAFGWIPVLVIYVNNLPLSGRMRVFILPFIVIEKASRGDEALHLHELQHCEDFYSDFPFYYWNYRDDERIRLIYECKAYARQYHFDPGDGKYDKFLAFLRDCYDLNMPELEVKACFDRYLKVAEHG